MRSLSSGEARSGFADMLTHVAYASEHVAIQRPGKEPVYLIPAKDYHLLQQLLKKAEDESDVEVAEARMADPDQELVSFDQFFLELGQ